MNPDKIAFPCPKCGSKLTAPANKAGVTSSCPKCKSPVKVPSPAEPDVPFEPLDSLDDAYRKTVVWLKGKDLPVHEPGLINDSLQSKDFGRVLLLANEKDEALVYLTPHEWTDERALEVANDLLRLYNRALENGDIVPSFEVLSAYPLPRPIAFLFGNSKAAHIELTLCTLPQCPPLEAAMSPMGIPALLEKVAIPMTWSLLGAELPLDDLASVVRLEKLILEEIRPERDPEKAMPEESFMPERLLFCLGAIFGTILQRSLGLRFQWVRDDGLPFCLGLLHRNYKGDQLSLNPFGKVMKLYLNGNGDSLVFLTKYVQSGRWKKSTPDRG